ncbi:MAG: hypothetical protein EHM21_02695, partial [Chloroflexi bacterium]
NGHERDRRNDVIMHPHLHFAVPMLQEFSQQLLNMRFIKRGHDTPPLMPNRTDAPARLAPDPARHAPVPRPAPAPAPAAPHC